MSCVYLFHICANRFFQENVYEQFNQQKQSEVIIYKACSRIIADCGNNYIENSADYFSSEKRANHQTFQIT